MPEQVLLYTLGCKVNQYDSEQTAAILAQQGVAVSENDPDVVVVHTCVVTSTAEAKSRQAVRRLRRLYPDARLILAGCGGRYDLMISQLPEADLVIGGDPQAVAAAILGTDLITGPLAVTGSRSRPLLKVQEGCQQNCAYCIVPSVRGAPDSRPVPDVITEAQELVRRGYREIVLCGTNLGLYGRDLKPESNLEQLIMEILPEIRGARLRISSLEPVGVTRSLAELIGKGDGVCRHLHLVLQSGSDHVLARMGRPYTRQQFMDLAMAARSVDDDCALTTDIIVGFPGESEKDFQQTLDCIRDVRFSRLHVFPFSPRPGTKAAEMEGRVEPVIAAERAREVAELGEALAEKFREQLVGKRLQVVIERVDDQGGHGVTDNYVRTTVAGYTGATGQIVSTIIECCQQDGLIGRMEQG